DLRRLRRGQPAEPEVLQPVRRFAGVRGRGEDAVVAQAAAQAQGQGARGGGPPRAPRGVGPPPPRRPPGPKGSPHTPHTVPRRGAALAKVFPTIRKLVAVVALLSGIVYGVFAPFRGWVNHQVGAVKTKITRIINPQYDAVHVDGGSGSGETGRSVKGHEAAKAVDGFSNTYWLAPATPSGGRDVVLILRFNEKVDV